MTQYLGLTNDNRVDHLVGYIDPPDMVGPLTPPPADTDQYTYVLWERPVSLAGTTSTEVQRWTSAGPVWIETAPMAEVIARALDEIDSEGDAARAAVLTKQTNNIEYVRAERQAREYAAADYPAEDVPSCVASWAKAKYRDAWTSKDAADDIIATADRWYGLLDQIRDLRLCAKEDVRHATDAADVAARAAKFSTDLLNLMKGLA